MYLLHEATVIHLYVLKFDLLISMKVLYSGFENKYGFDRLIFTQGYHLHHSGVENKLFFDWLLFTSRLPSSSIIFIEAGNRSEKC